MGGQIPNPHAPVIYTQPGQRGSGCPVGVPHPTLLKPGLPQSSQCPSPVRPAELPRVPGWEDRKV